MPSLPAARFSGILCSRDLILKVLHINSSIPSKLPCEIIFWCTKLPIPQIFHKFSNAQKRFLHMTVTALYLVSTPTVDGSHDFLLFLMLCQNFLGKLSHEAMELSPWLQFCASLWSFDKLSINIWTIFYFLPHCRKEVHFRVYDYLSRLIMNPIVFFLHPCSTQDVI